MANLRELREWRAEIVDRMIEIPDLCETEDRDLTDEDLQEYDELEARFNKLEPRIKRAGRVDKLNEELN